MPDLPGVKQKVIGLVSGGKDSCFNLMHCIANGHEVVALATLTPEPGVDELDSHLYQSVGTHLLPLLAKAMDLPLFTRVIKGKAVERGPEYGSRLRGGAGSGQAGDETEDLTSLLENVLTAHPEATALSSGAILSTYQRLRIEHVCSRLNLTSLSYLWQMDQMPLLDRMLSSGIEAILMKVAGVGLGVNMVGKQLGQVRGTLAKLEERYGSHPAGEGGEYETLTLSTPLFSHRLVLKKTQTIITDPEPYPVAYLKVEEAVLEEKEGWEKPTVSELREMLGLDEVEVGPLDEEGQEVLEELRKEESAMDLRDLSLAAIRSAGTASGIEEHKEEQERGPTASFARRGRWFVASVEGVTLPDQSVGDELRQCFDAISGTLAAHSLSLPLQATHITLLLSSMALFQPANEVYKTYFGTSPPSRATVAVPIESGRVRVEVVGFDDRPIALAASSAGGEEPHVQAEGSTGVQRVGGRQALHVQGLSYWAPANIGPYSQAVVVNCRIHLAGQIPLIPASLTLPSPSANLSETYAYQSSLALQHVRRIVNVLKSKNSTGGGWEGWVESIVGWWALPPATSTVTAGGLSSDGALGRAGTTESGQEGERWARRGWSAWVDKYEAHEAPAIFVQAKELPKGALVEYQVNYHTGRRAVIDDVDNNNNNNYHDRDLASTADNSEDEDNDEELQVVYSSGASSSSGLWWEASETRTVGARGEPRGKKAMNQGSRAAIFFSDLAAVATHTQTHGISPVLSKGNPISMRVYHHTDRTSVIDFLEKLGVERGRYTLIPVLGVCDRRGRRADVVLEVFGI